MRENTDTSRRSLHQLRMGVLGSVTAVVLCFGAAAAFAGDPAERAAQEAFVAR
ncbi:hypothetical protein [Pontixanthobacter sp.]|uniref:hypothetical protein n=1 Tax=Pontixanthobacter sp. TaxID=2792078 RepID=UPI003C7D030C